MIISIVSAMVNISFFKKFNGSGKIVFIAVLLFSSCTQNSENENENMTHRITEEKTESKKIKPEDIVLEKDFLYDQYTLPDSYPYKDTTRMFQWDKIKQGLFLLDSVQTEHSDWAILQNYKNMNGEAPLVKKFERNAYTRISDMMGVERFQSVPLFALNDTAVGERYGRDGFLVKYWGEEGRFAKVSTVSFDGEWLVPKRYLKRIGDTIVFRKAIFVDVTNQNIATLEKVDSKWLIRSMNPVTTGLHKPPYQQETPQGIFVVQEHKPRMIFLKDGLPKTGGYAPYASRFTCGAYLHGIPVNTSDENSKKTIEYSPTLGTTPHSHMCVRNATSHAKFIYDWAVPQHTIVFVIG